MGLHDDHRKRLREQYAKNGMGSLTEERLLELILFTPIPRKDTYDISKRLLKRFGNRRGVREANIEDLQEIEDEGEIYETIEDVWPDYPTKEDFLFNEDEY